MDEINERAKVTKKALCPTRLRELRKNQNLSIRELGKAVGYNFSFISMIESEIRDVSMESLICFCDYFGCTTDYFLYRSDNFADKKSKISADAIQVAKNYDKLQASQKSIINRMIAELLKESN